MNGPMRKRPPQARDGRSQPYGLLSCLAARRVKYSPRRGSVQCLRRGQIVTQVETIVQASSFTRDKLEWLERVQDDRSVSPSAMSLAFAISRHINRKTLDAFPSQKTLADLVGIKPRQVRTLISALVARGHLHVESGGFQRPDRYRIASPERQPTTSIKAAVDCRSATASKRQSSALESGSGLPANPLKEPSEVNSIESSPLVASHSTRPKKGSKFAPEDWSPSEADLDHGQTLGLTLQEIERQAAKLRNHEFKAPKTDWSRAFRVWLINAAEWESRRSSASDFASIVAQRRGFDAWEAVDMQVEVLGSGGAK